MPDKCNLDLNIHGNDEAHYRTIEMILIGFILFCSVGTFATLLARGLRLPKDKRYNLKSHQFKIIFKITSKKGLDDRIVAIWHFSCF